MVLVINYLELFRLFIDQVEFYVARKNFCTLKKNFLERQNRDFYIKFFLKFENFNLNIKNIHVFVEISIFNHQNLLYGQKFHEKILQLSR